MKRSYFLLFLVLFFISSCAKYIDADNSYLSYGMVKKDGANWFIKSDNGNRLNVVQNDAKDFSFSDDLRVIANYGVIGNPVDTNFDIHLYAISSVMTKQPLTLSTLSEEQLTEIGNDPIDLMESWYGASKYLNTTFEFLSGSQETIHYINLLYDDVSSSSDTLVFEFRHNANSDITFYNTLGLASFPISDLIPEGKTEMKIHLKWIDYDLNKRYTIGTVTRGNSNNSDPYEPKVHGNYWTENVQNSFIGYE